MARVEDLDQTFRIEAREEDSNSLPNNEADLGARTRSEVVQSHETVAKRKPTINDYFARRKVVATQLGLWKGQERPLEDFDKDVGELGNALEIERSEYESVRGTVDETQADDEYRKEASVDRVLHKAVMGRTSTLDGNYDTRTASTEPREAEPSKDDFEPETDYQREKPHSTSVIPLYLDGRGFTQRSGNLYPSFFNVDSTNPTRGGLYKSTRAVFPIPKNLKQGPSIPVVEESGTVECRTKSICWDHGCNGRVFSTFSDLHRHQRERAGTYIKSTCHRCGAEFTRITALKRHQQFDMCQARILGKRKTITPTKSEEVLLSREKPDSYLHLKIASAEPNLSPDCDYDENVGDLERHMPTHQLTRPEKCPVGDCAYHEKGFARKYDAIRHAHTHYKGTISCGFCSLDDSGEEIGFNRVDVFRRHLSKIHHISQITRRRINPTTPDQYHEDLEPQAPKQVSVHRDGTSGLCSICSKSFKNAQILYDHLDDCVLRALEAQQVTQSDDKQHLDTGAKFEAYNTVQSQLGSPLPGAHVDHKRVGRVELADSPTFIFPENLSELIIHSPQDLLLLDLRGDCHYTQSRIPGALNFCTPTKYPGLKTLDVQDILNSISDQKKKLEFPTWSHIKFIVVYDAALPEIEDTNPSVKPLRDFTDRGYEGSTLILHGGFDAFVKAYPIQVDRSPVKEVYDGTSVSKKNTPLSVRLKALRETHRRREMVGDTDGEQKTNEGTESRLDESVKPTAARGLLSIRNEKMERELAEGAPSDSKCYIKDRSRQPSPGDHHSNEVTGGISSRAQAYKDFKDSVERLVALKADRLRIESFETTPKMGEVSQTQSRNIIMLTKFTVFFLPLSFALPLLGIDDIDSKYNFRVPGFITLLICFSCPIGLIVSAMLNTEKGYEFWTQQIYPLFMRTYWRYVLVLTLGLDMVSKLRIADWMPNMRRLKLLRSRLGMLKSLFRQTRYAAMGFRKELPHGFRLMNGQEYTVFNTAKRYIEYLTGETWDWWPFVPSFRPLPIDETRYEWRCVSGHRHWSVEAWYNNSLYMNDLTEESEPERITVKPSTAAVPEHRDASISSSSSQMSGSSSCDGRSSPSTSDTSSSSQHGDSAESDDNESSKQGKSPSGNGVAVNIVPPGRLDGYILFGVEGSKRLQSSQTRLAQIDVTVCEDDDSFFDEMKIQYKRLRGYLRWVFSIWVFHRCEFIMFHKANPKEIMPGPGGMPSVTDRDYRFDAGPDPPVLGSVFNAGFYGCNKACIRSRLDVMSFFHECKGRNHCGKYRVLQRLPKRLRKWDIDSDEEKDEAWGLHAAFAVSFYKVVIYHLLILVGPTTFWGFWLKKWPTDWQNASVPFFAVVVLLSLFWLPFAHTADARGRQKLKMT